MTDLWYVPASELSRIHAVPGRMEPKAAAFAAACRINAFYMIARAGSGHVGTTFSCIDLVSWVFLNELQLPEAPGAIRDLYFSSKGHDAPALYAVLTALGLLEFDRIHRLRRLEGLPGHPDVGTPWIEANTGSLGMGISKAKGMVLANRLLGQPAQVYVMTGDGELQEGQIWESLASGANLRLGEITAIVDHNKIQSDTWVTEVNDLGDLTAKFRAFGWHVERCDGHDMASIAGAFGRLRAVADRPKVLIADTVKGKGVSFMEPAAMDPADRLYRYHSGAPGDEAYEHGVEELIATANARLGELEAGKIRLERERRPVSPGPGTVHRLVTAYSRELVRQAERHPNLVVLDADLVLDCGLIPFRARFPERFVECGIAEQDMVSQAGGMALRGLIPIVHSFACFLSTRPNEQIYNNATERTKVIYVASLAGLLPAGPGHSHQSVRDISALGGVPDLVMIEPCNEAETEQTLDFCVNEASWSSYIRLVSIPAETPYVLPSDYRLAPGRGVVLREGRDAALVGYGPVLLTQAWRAAELLAHESRLEVAVINLPWLNRVDRQWLSEIAARYPWIFTLDNHYLHGGQGQLLLADLVELPERPLPHARRLGVTRIPLSGGNTEVLRAHHLDAEGLAGQVREALATAT